VSYRKGVPGVSAVLLMALERLRPPELLSRSALAVVACAGRAGAHFGQQGLPRREARQRRRRRRRRQQRRRRGRPAGGTQQRQRRAHLAALALGQQLGQGRGAVHRQHDRLAGLHHAQHLVQLAVQTHEEAVQGRRCGGGAGGWAELGSARAPARRAAATAGCTLSTGLTASEGGVQHRVEVDVHVVDGPDVLELAVGRPVGLAEPHVEAGYPHRVRVCSACCRLRGETAWSAPLARQGMVGLGHSVYVVVWPVQVIDRHDP
jgi:hypothetical protein